MPCYYPLKAFDTFGKTDKGKPQYRITPYKINHIEFQNGKWINIDQEFASPFAEKVSRKFTVIPCGKCIGCRIAYSREWANRCMLENMYHNDSWFISLTYNDNNLPMRSTPWNDDWIDVPTLQKHDFQLFMKRLRQNYERSGYPTDEDYHLRYFACGEYGGETHRPHYHAIIYGLKLPDSDLTFYKHDPRGYDYWISDLIDKTWNKGYAIIGKVNWDTCAYTARYILKKIRGPDAEEFYYNSGFDKEFVVMSRKPGIAMDYYEQNKDKIYEFDKIIFGTDEKSFEIKPPKYYDRLFDHDDPESLQKIKEIRKERAEQIVAQVEKESGQDYLEHLKKKEDAFKQRASSVLKGRKKI